MNIRLNTNLNKTNTTFKSKEPTLKTAGLSTNLLKDEPSQASKWTKIIAFGTGGLAIAAWGYKGIKKLSCLNIFKQSAAAREKMLIKQVQKDSVYFHFPELKVATELKKTIKEKNTPKWDNKEDIDFFKDEFTLRILIPAKQLKVVRESTNPKLQEAFKSKPFCFVDDGIMIHGTDRPEKKELFNLFLNQAKEHEFEIVKIDTKDGNSQRINGEIIKTFKAAEERYLKEMKQTMIVLEDTDALLQKDDGFARGSWNEYSHKCGMKGITTLTSAKSAEALDPTCIRGGRIKHKIDIDEALKLQAEADALK